MKSQITGGTESRLAGPYHKRSFQYGTGLHPIELSTKRVLWKSPDNAGDCLDSGLLSTNGWDDLTAEDSICTTHEHEEVGLVSTRILHPAFSHS